MNAIVTTEAVSAETLEHVLGTGDLGKLSTQQRVEYYAKTCQSLGLNPLTRPMRFLALNGQIQLYFTRDGTDQLRKAQGITLHVVDKLIDAGLFTVTVRARTKDGREDEDIGAVVLPQSGESRANALMKAMTKAKRRVTLSICGLGQTDESELDTMPGAQVFDAEDDLPVAPLRAVAAATPRAPRVTEKAEPHQTFDDPLLEPDGRKWLANLRTTLEAATSREEVEAIGAHITVGNAILNAPPAIKRDISALLADHYKRLADDDGDAASEDLEDVQIAGAEKLAAG